GHHPFTKSKFTTSLSSAAKKVGIKPLQGHGVDIDSTLKYLLCNIPFDVVKIKGCWPSDAFLVYLQCHAQILAPYIHTNWQYIPEPLLSEPQRFDLLGQWLR
ncbi:hypothetical protein PAXRUDRAFT_151013, partial [Paxillus rubicundulus Ve08.2h10]